MLVFTSDSRPYKHCIDGIEMCAMLCNRLHILFGEFDENVSYILSFNV